MYLTSDLIASLAALEPTPTSTSGISSIPVPFDSSWCMDRGSIGDWFGSTSDIAILVAILWSSKLVGRGERPVGWEEDPASPQEEDN